MGASGEDIYSRGRCGLDKNGVRHTGKGGVCAGQVPHGEIYPEVSVAPAGQRRRCQERDIQCDKGER